MDTSNSEASANKATLQTPKYPNQVTGMYILARALRTVGITNMYGLVGIPVTDFAYIAQEQGIRFAGFHHEQNAGMAAATHGYLTKTPGVLLTVSSLGFLNGLTATANATVNCYPMIQISGSSEREPIDLGQGTYEGLDQLSIAKPLVKAAYRVNKPEDIPTAVVRAYRAAISGRPGGAYLDITTPCLGAIMNMADAEKLFYKPVDLVPAMVPSEESVKRAVELISSAKKPVFLIGKGAAYAQVENKVKQLVESTGIPFYPMSMAKGLMPDNHPLSAISCRSTIMQQADVVVLIGARLNWLLSRGHGKWNFDTKFVQLDIDPQEIDINRPIAAPVIGDLDSSLTAILSQLGNHKTSMDPAWVTQLQAETKVKKNKLDERLQQNASTQPMNHWTALSAIKPVLESNPDVILVNEGANTLDDTRDAVNMSLPRHRIDCATWAIMGMGMGSCIGAAMATGKSVVAVEGDSAFGFSGMEFSTICRFKLPVTVVIFNNGGIYNGIGVNMSNDGDPAPTTLDVNARFDKIGDAFGAQTYYVTNPADLKNALSEAIASKKPCLIDVQLAADSGKESGHIGYLNPASLQNITV
ncbi:oxalyl-CoA decarboxylase [uncultured Muribaculum sp.]|jgi:oxalyl-CoA decarboxylase|uniref:oxalyl-CoA decarboxylase n=1 Tax=uncultured Muribaculum sp. TaxID=1918613 RepID=UPI0025B27D5B|nr:oxalyl-CoA decarboxylase [uncultured Muribaculum sp.]